MLWCDDECVLLAGIDFANGWHTCMFVVTRDACKARKRQIWNKILWYRNMNDSYFQTKSLEVTTFGYFIRFSIPRATLSRVLSVSYYFPLLIFRFLPWMKVSKYLNVQMRQNTSSHHIKVYFWQYQKIREI